MKVLIYGAGILGQLYAYLLSKEQVDVTLLARGSTLEELRREGIKLNFYLQNEKVQAMVPLTSKLGPEDRYDLIIVVMQKNQAVTILDTLSAVKSKPDIMFLGNNGTGLNDYCPPLDPDQVILGFPSAGGMRIQDGFEVIYSPKSSISLGEIGKETSERLEKYQKFFQNAKISAKIIDDIDAWLKYHIALVSPLANGLIAVDCNNYLFAESPKLLNLCLSGIRESFRVLKKLGYPMRPSSLKTFLLPKFLLGLMFKKKLKSHMAEVAMAGHAKFAQAEMKQIAVEFQDLTKKSGLKTPALDQLFQYLDPTFPRYSNN